ncbi:MAG TPA: hypothetical protein DEV81_02235 [Cyanobacteria bacterium UBA11049]|nr:hypothetical protein [Cyanobacteria bacterium UBA11049]
MNSCKRNVSGIKESAKKKRLQTIAKAEEGIKQLIRQSKPITFEAVAEVSGVSRAWLYKEPEIKTRIEYLRNQQQSKKSVPPDQRASEASNAAKAKALLQEIKKLRAENQGLRHHIEEILGRSIYADEQAERYKKEAEVLKVKNAELEQQLEECRCCKVEAPVSPPHNSKVTSLKQNRMGQSGISDKIKQQQVALGIQLNSTLTKTIKSTASEEIVLFAIQALSEAIERGNIENPGGWLNAAIKDGWMPSEKHLPGEKTERDIFKEWFDLAYKKRLVLAATKGDDGQMYVYTIDGAPLSFKQMLSDYPIEKLK